jgi:flagellar biosynthesis/type III secretory pathway chaperone
MEVICLEDKAFYALIEQVVSRLKTENTNLPARWITAEEAMTILQIKSATTLQKLRDVGKIRFSQPEKKIILYDRESINEFIEKNARNTF